MKKTAVFVIFLAILLSFQVYATEDLTLVGGKVYYNNFNTPANNTQVNIQCTHNGTLNSGQATTIYDGSYAAYFNLTECAENDSVTASASNGNYNGNSQAIVVQCDGNNVCDVAYLAIANIVMTEPQVNPQGGGGGGGGLGGAGLQNPFVSLSIGANNIQKNVYYTFFIGTERHTLELITIGGDYVEILISSTPKLITINLGQTKEVDVNDDNINDISIKTSSLSSTGRAVIDFRQISPISSPEGSKNETQPAPELKEPTPQEGFFSGLTGAAIGALGTGGMIIVIIFITLIIIGAVSVYVTRKRKK